MTDTKDFILRFPELRAMCGLSRSTIWRLEREGSFPKRVQLSPNAVGWSRNSVSQWLESRTAV